MSHSENASKAIESSIVSSLIRARDRAYAPYSNHPVGALIISDSGSRYVGANVEVAHHKSLCAEASAIAAMVSAGERLGVVIQHRRKTGVAFTVIGALKIVSKFPQLALSHWQVASFEFFPVKLALESNSGMVCPAWFVAIQTMFAFNLCPCV